MYNLIRGDPSGTIDLRLRPSRDLNILAGDAATLS